MRICSAGDQLPANAFSIAPVQIVVRVTLQDIKTNPPKFIDVWVVDFCQEAYFGRSHWIVVGKEELELEYASCPLVSDWDG